MPRSLFLHAVIWPLTCILSSSLLQISLQMQEEVVLKLRLVTENITEYFQEY